MRGRVLVVLLALASLLAIISPSLDPALSPAGPSASSPSPYPLPGGERDQLGGTVGRVGDGDTIYVRRASGGGKGRDIGGDTPEGHHPTRGEEPRRPGATEVDRRLLGHDPGPLETDAQPRDRHRR